MSAVLAAALWLTTGGWAKSETVIHLKVGDVLGIAGSKIFCHVTVSHNVVPSKTAIICFKGTANSQLDVGSYVVELADDTASEFLVQRTSTPKLVFRSPASAGPKVRVVQAHVGDVAVVSGTRIACSIGRNSSSKPYILCFIVFSNNAPRPHTYAVVETDAQAAVLHTGADGHQTSTLYSMANP